MRIYEGNILTCDAQDHVYKYLVEDSGRIVHVGDELPAKYASGTRVKLGNRALIPAFGDSHIHLTNIDEYIAAYDGEIKERMIALRALIHSCHSDITEKIAWSMPTFVLKGNLVHFSAEKKHLGFHPGKKAIDIFADRFDGLTHTKSTLHLPYNKPMPWELLRDMVEFCVQENLR